ncbi:PP2C family protein-serine/threonine phosphatase [Streptomyces sp. 4N509B]|uniref:PP2C family protein-serine/threonine phosphatase n=1 Tax=Streptomyces sp. 4N509B TaxID=3457413 RepID=UPI003FCEF9D7
MLSFQPPDHSTDDAADGACTDGPDAGDLTTLDTLIARTHRLRQEVEAVRRAGPSRGSRQRIRRAVWDLTARQLEDVGERLDELRATTSREGRARLGGRVGSAEWNLLTDGVTWSPEVFAIFGRDERDGPLTLDQLPSRLLEQDQPTLTAAVTACLVDGRPMDCEFRVVRQDGSTRTVQLSGEPILDDRGGTVAMWAVFRDVSEVRRSETAVRDAVLGEGGAGALTTGSALGPSAREGEELRRQRRVTRAEQGVAVELAQAALAPWLGPPETGPAGEPGTLELAARYLPARDGAPMSGKWYDALALPDGSRLLSVGDLSGQGPAAAASTATALGAVRGIALTGAAPGDLLGYLNQLLDHGMHPVLASAVCCRYEPAPRGAGGTLVWAQAGHPAPMLCRRGVGRGLARPAGPLLGTVTDAGYAQRTDRLEPGDVLVLATDGLFPAIPEAVRTVDGVDRRLAALAPRLSTAGSAEHCLEELVESCGETGRQDDACVLVARVVP